MKRLGTLLYGLICYAIFLATFLYLVGFVGNFWPALGLGDAPLHSLNSGGARGPVGEAVLVDVLLLGVFAVQHSVMARAGFKKRWTRIIPQAVERSTYVLASSLCLDLIFWQWRPIETTPLWSVTGAPALALIGVSFLGWLIVLLSTFLLDHFDLFGLKQVVCAYRGVPQPKLAFRTPLLYQAVRHPIYLGFIIAFWATPFMTLGHLVFAAAMTVYVLVAIQLEERDLVRIHGDTYRAYRRQVWMLLPFPRSSSVARIPQPR